jgi:hypothetical protein
VVTTPDTPALVLPPHKPIQNHTKLHKTNHIISKPHKTQKKRPKGYWFLLGCLFFMDLVLLGVEGVLVCNGVL